MPTVYQWDKRIRRDVADAERRARAGQEAGSLLFQNVEDPDYAPTPQEEAEEEGVETEAADAMEEEEVEHCLRHLFAERVGDHEAWGGEA